MQPRPDALEFYRRQGVMTDPGSHATALKGMPADPVQLAGVLQGLILHEHWAPAYGQTLSEAQRGEVHLRTLPAIIDTILAHDPRPLVETRAVEDRVVGNCRDFTLFTVATLRAGGTPARGRCGFATYFSPTQKVDHWVAEYWEAARNRWGMADAQIDALMAGHIRPDFDLLDVPEDRFLTAGKAWQACRAGEADPDLFGIMQMSGWWFIAGNLVRDTAALAGTEMLPWDCWGVMSAPGEAMTDGTLAWLDRLASLTTDPDTNFDEILRISREDERQTIPPLVFNAVRGRPERV